PPPADAGALATGPAPGAFVAQPSKSIRASQGSPRTMPNRVRVNRIVVLLRAPRTYCPAARAVKHRELREALERLSNSCSCSDVLNRQERSGETPRSIQRGIQ